MIKDGTANVALNFRGRMSYTHTSVEWDNEGKEKNKHKHKTRKATSTDLKISAKYTMKKSKIWPFLGDL